MHTITAVILDRHPSTTFECECCGRALDPHTLTWLELNHATHEWARPGTAPWSDGPESQGSFTFGKACARRKLREQST